MNWKPRTEEKYTGEFVQFIYQRDDTRFVILRMEDGHCCVGNANHTAFYPGMVYTFTGHWEKHDKYGLQFKFSSFASSAPVTSEQVKTYLRRYLGHIKRLGAAGIRKMVADVGPACVVEKIKADPKWMASIANIDLDEARHASKTMIRLEKFEDARIKLSSMLEGSGLPSTAIEKALDDMGESAADIIHRDPFTMMVRGYKGAGFSRCDTLYVKFGCPEKGLKRQFMALHHYMKTKNAGSTWFPLKEAAKHIRFTVSVDVDPTKAIELGLRSKRLVLTQHKGEYWIGSRAVLESEDQIQTDTRRLLCGNHPG